MGFSVTLFNVLITLLFILPGYILCKLHKASASHLSSLSTILVYVCSPCMVITAFMSVEYSLELLGKMGLFFLVTLICQILFMVIIYFIFKKKMDDPKFRVLNIACTFGNVGFFGLPIIKALLPSYPEALCYSSVFVITMNILVFTYGVYCLTRDRKYMSIKQAILNPSTIALIISIPLFIFGVKEYTPKILFDSFELLGKMTTPLCMIILGIRLATCSLKKIFTNYFVYFITFLKMIIFPLFSYLLVAFLPFDYAFKASVLILCSVPGASIILNLAEIYHSEEELAANSVLISTLLSFITMPLVLLIL